MNSFRLSTLYATISVLKIDIFQIISHLDCGYDSIYIVDEKGNYLGKTILRNRLVEYWNKQDNVYNFAVNMVGIYYDNDEKVMIENAKHIFSKFSIFNEIPIILNNKIVAVYRKKDLMQNNTKQDTEIYEWDIVLMPSMKLEQNIYISSLGNRIIKRFYDQYKEILDLKILNKNNYINVFSKKKNLLIYYNDIYPDCNKICIYDFWRMVKKEKISRMIKFSYIGLEWAEYTYSKKMSRKFFIEQFDDCRYSVFITNSCGDFLGVITKDKFRENFLSFNELIPENISICHHTDINDIKIEFVEKIFQTKIKELPITNNGKIMASIRLGKSPMLQNNENNYPPVYWNLLSDDIMGEFMGDRKKILLSSGKGVLRGFKERFDHMYEICVYDDTIYDKIFVDEFDVFIYGADIWDKIPIPSFSAQKLYTNLLAEQVRRFLQQNQVVYCSVESISNHVFKRNCYHRALYCGRIEASPLMFGGKYRDYLVHSDKYSPSWNSSGGIRFTTNLPITYDNTVYIFGACSVAGIFVEDKETISSYLQHYFNENNIAYRVMNCGNNGGYDGASLNELYRIMDTEFHSGDIVVHFNNNIWQYAFKKNVKKHVKVEDIFTSPDAINCKPFRDFKDPNHFNPIGNKVIARFLSKTLCSYTRKLPAYVKAKKMPSFFSLYPFLHRNDKNRDLEKYINNITQHFEIHDNSGAIVMNANPFTKGHLYLVECALKQVDYLYIFVVEEDLSEFTFRERYMLVKKNCESLNNIRVLPSGKYIISLTTFAEYFRKDTITECTYIYPVADVSMFGKWIAPALGIRKRFVGEEPMDFVTAMYNQALKNLLPHFGVDTIIIPRLALANGEIISASTVRHYIKNKNFEECRQYLTDITYNYICKTYATIQYPFKKL